MIHQGPIAGIAAAGNFIATAGYDNQLILWDALSKRAVARSHHDHLVNHCAFNSDGTMTGRPAGFKVYARKSASVRYTYSPKHTQAWLHEADRILILGVE
jgi:WD40 repeat protein